LLTAFWREGALGGASPEEAFSVRCDRSTMSQNDLDNGRLRAEVSILPVAAVERISVVLDLTGGGAAPALAEALREVA
jgi:phage tail sheath protein FI